MSKFDLVSVGLTAVDVLVRLPENILLNDKQMVHDLIIQGGAPVGSSSVGLARLGYRVGTVARLGDNTLSAIAREEFESQGVSTELIIHDPDARPAIALVQIDPKTAARTVFIQMDHYGYIRPDDIPVDAIHNSRLLLVDSYDLEATRAALKAAAESSCRSILDFESGDSDTLRELLPLGDDAVLPLGCGRQITGVEDPKEVLFELSKLTESEIVVTDGINGSWGLDRMNKMHVIHQKAFLVDAVDSTGCGDAFHTGYMVGLLEDWPLHLRMEFGAVLASRVATRVGGRTALPDRAGIAYLRDLDVSSALLKALKPLDENT